MGGSRFYEFCLRFLVEAFISNNNFEEYSFLRFEAFLLKLFLRFLAFSCFFFAALLSKKTLERNCWRNSPMMLLLEF